MHIFLDLEWKYYLETYTVLRRKALADYQGRHKPEVNQSGVSTCRTTVPEPSIVLCTIWDCLTSSVSFVFTYKIMQVSFLDSQAKASTSLQVIPLQYLISVKYQNTAKLNTIYILLSSPIRSVNLANWRQFFLCLSIDDCGTTRLRFVVPQPLWQCYDTIFIINKRTDT